MSPAPKRDIVFLVADNGIKQVLKGFLSREPHRRLGCGKFGIDPELEIRVEPTNDPGVYIKAHELLQPYEHSHEHAVVILDADWDGSPGAGAIRKNISQRLTAGWREFAVIVIEPELEAWLMNENEHLASIFKCPDNYREILTEANFWSEGASKPQRPKEALDYLRQWHGARASNAEFGKLAATMSVRHCHDPAFVYLRSKLCAWFPEQP